MSADQIVAVVGAGTMGHGIAYVALAAGYQVALVDADPAMVERGVQRIRSGFEKAIERGKSAPNLRDAAMARLVLPPSLARGVAAADIVIEAIPERLELKQALFEEVESLARPSVLLGSNTSSLSITALGTRLRDPSRLLGLHFFNPVPVMRLVELVRGEHTSDTALDRGRAFATTLGKTPIVVRDSPGFATSRLGVVLGLEAIRMLEQGIASAGDIDRAMELGYNHPMGPLRLTDVVGLDVRLAIAEHLHATLHDQTYRPPELLRRMVAEGRLGRKSGQGFYRWESDS